MPQLDSSAWMLIAAAAFIAGWMLGRRSASSDTGDKADRWAQARQRAEAAFASLPPAARQEADRLIGARNYIAAIKLVRDQSGLDLRGAKLAIDERKRSMGA